MVGPFLTTIIKASTTAGVGSGRNKKNSCVDFLRVCDPGWVGAYTYYYPIGVIVE